MKNMFDRNGFVLSGLDAKQKKRACAVMLAVAFFFVLSAFTLMDFLYVLAGCVGAAVSGSGDVALRDALRSLPVILSFFMTLSGLMTAHTFYRNESSDILRRRAKKHAVIGMVIGVMIIGYVIFGLASGRYLSITEGAPTAMYPLDSLLYAAVFILLGASVLVFFGKSPEDPHKSLPVRAPLQKRGRIIRSFFRGFWLLIGLYGFCGFFYSFFVVDFTIGYVPYIAAYMLVSLTAFLTVAVWELYYNNLTEEKRRAVTLPLGLISLAVSVPVTVFYFIALKNNLDGPANVGFGLLPIAFTASVNVPGLLVIPVPLIVSVTALIKGLIRRSRN